MEEIKVSVVVVAYNAGRYIVETLNSIYNQTYQNIELIISDDGSTDATVAIAKEWVEAHRNRFEGLQLRADYKNYGLVHNANEGFALATGKYIKIFAADDCMVPTGIADLVQCAEQNAADIVIGRVNCFTDAGEYSIPERDYSIYQLPVEQQYQMLLNYNMLDAPAGMVRAETWRRLGGYDDNYPMMEDYPFWLKATRNGVRLVGCEKIVTNYRISEESITSAINDKMVGKSYFKCYKRFLRKEKLIPMWRNGLRRQAGRELKEVLYKDLVILFGNKRSSKMTKRLTKLFYS